MIGPARARRRGDPTLSRSHTGKPITSAPARLIPYLTCLPSLALHLQVIGFQGDIRLRDLLAEQVYTFGPTTA